MKYQKHYLSEDGNNKHCPINERPCDSWCAWFDHEEQDCKLIGGLLDIKYELKDISKNIFDGFDALFQKT